MFQYITKKRIIISTLLLTVLLLVITEPFFHLFHKGFFTKFESSILEPVFFWTTSLFLSSFILVFFSNNIFEFWLKKFLVWYLPLGLFLTFMADTSVSYTFPNKVGLAIWFGSILIFATLVIVLTQKFYFKR